MTDELVEAVARALVKSHRLTWSGGAHNILQATYLRDARVAIAAYEAALWQPIETAPKLELFDIWTADENRLPDCKRDQDGGIYFIDDTGNYNPVPDATHWRQRPQPPGGAK